MYLVGFYSPKEKAGVTETALLVAGWLKENTSLSVAFVSNGKLEKEPINEQTIHRFADLPYEDQKQKMKELKSSFDIVIYDASSGLSAEILNLLPIADRLFILGEDDSRFALTLQEVIGFFKAFDGKSRDLINEIHENRTYVLQNGDHMIGFTKPKQDIEDVGKIIYRDYSLYFLHQNFAEKYRDLVSKMKQIPREKLGTGAYEFGIDFEKSMLFQKYVLLREVSGQPYEEALESVIPLIIANDYETILERFQNEIYVAQIGFGQRR